MNKPTRIFIHTTDASYKTIPKQFFAVNSWHKERFGDYCKSSMGYYGGYHILIEPDGWEGRYREDWEEACAVKGWNARSLNVAMAFDGDIEMPTDAQITTLRKRLTKWSEQYNIPLISVEFLGPHRLESPGKTCYGSLLSDDWGVKLMNTEPKNPDSSQQKDEIEARRTLLLNQLRLLVLQLTILVGKWTGLVNQRQKTPPIY